MLLATSGAGRVAPYRLLVTDAPWTEGADGGRGLQRCWQEANRAVATLLATQAETPFRLPSPADPSTAESVAEAIVAASGGMQRDAGAAKAALRELVRSLVPALHATLQPALKVLCRPPTSPPKRVLLHLPAGPGWQVAGQTAAAVLEVLSAVLQQQAGAAAGGGACDGTVQLLLSAGGASEAEEAATAPAVGWLPITFQAPRQMQRTADAAVRQLDALFGAGRLQWLQVSRRTCRLCVWHPARVPAGLAGTP